MRFLMTAMRCSLSYLFVLLQVGRKRSIVLITAIVIEYPARRGTISGIVRRLSPAMDDGVRPFGLNPAAAAGHAAVA